MSHLHPFTPSDRVPPSRRAPAPGGGLLEITFPEDGDPRLTFQHHDVDGRPIGVRLELRASELRP